MVMAKKKDRVRREVEEKEAAGVTSLTIIQIIIQVGSLAQILFRRLLTIKDRF